MYKINFHTDPMDSPLNLHNHLNVFKKPVGFKKIQNSFDYKQPVINHL